MHALRFVAMISLFIALATPTATLAGEEAVSFKSGDLSLSGTLILPAGEGPFPAVVFVHGSGAETRDNSSYSARWLASIGYAALIYDKRGTGKSEGSDDDWRRFSFENLANDVVAAVDYLKSHKKIDSDKIGLHAASQGGWVAALATSKTKAIRFMVIKSASVCTVGEDRIFERSARLAREGFSAEEISQAKEMQLVEAKRPDDTRPDPYNVLFEKYKNARWFSRVYPGDSPTTEALVSYRTWYATIVDFDPVKLLKESDVPVCWIFGDPELDQSGPVEASIAAVSDLKEQGKPYLTLQFEEQGHNIEESVYERALFDWLNDVNDYQGYEFKKHWDQFEK